MSDVLKLEQIAPRLNEDFTIDFDDADTVTLRLAEAEDLKSADLPEASRPPFSLLFEGPAEPLLPQRLYALKNDAFGELVVFLVPVGGDEKSNRYEAVFN